jgi:putative oxidoreductase
MATATSSIVARARHAHVAFAQLCDRVQPVLALVIRLYVARVFLLSGLTKIRSWDSTLALFENEYHVPVLSPAVAAALGTATELGLPLLLVAGLGTRAAALALFAFNIVAVISYPDLSDAGLKDHMLWGALLLVLAVYGPGSLSLDRWFARRP